MRVALYHNLPPGGALRTIWEFARRCGEDVDVDLFTLDFGKWNPFGHGVERDFSAHVNQIHRLPVDAGTWSTALGGKAHRFGLLRGIRTAEREIAHMINTGGYDVAYVHPCWFSQTPSLLRDLSLPTVYYMQEVRRATFEKDYRPPSPKALRHAPGRAVEQHVERTLRQRDIDAAEKPDSILCNSRFSAETIAACYGRVARISHLGIDESVFTTLASEQPENAVMSVGGLEAFKGHHLVVEAVGALPFTERPHVHLVYERREESYREQLLSLALARGVTIHEHRAIPDEEVASLFRRSHATVLAAQREPLGLVALESIACGTPVVAFDEGGYRDTVRHGVNGLLVPKSPDALSSGLRAILAGELRVPAPDIRASVLPYWTWDAAVRRQLRHLHELARSPR